MEIAFFLVAFMGVFLAMFRSLGWGFLAVIAVGYFSGVIRSNYLGVFTTFMFDAAMAGLYLGFFSRKSLRATAVRPGPARWFVCFLIVWPSFLCLLPINDFLIQCVGLRAAIWFLPVLLIATRLTTADLAVLARGLVVLNLLALAVGVYIYLYGVQALYPMNAVTRIIYNSHDVGGMVKYHRVPSSFLSAHAYGGTMVQTLPFLVDRLAGAKVRLLDRCLAAAGVVAAAGGLLMCGARLPLVVCGCALVIACVLTRFSLKLALLVSALVGVGSFVASTNERFQRALTLTDSEAVSERINVSANEQWLEIMTDYPMGAGLGSAAGTSIPFFLANVAPEQVGAENEYARIVVEQGWCGLAGWLALIAWLYSRPPPARPPAPWRLGAVFMYSLTLTSWMTAFIGTGMLTSIPASFFLLTQMGILALVRDQGAVPDARDIRSDGLAGPDVGVDLDEVPVEDLGVGAGPDLSDNQ